MDTNNGYAHLMLIRGSQAEVKALQEEDVKQRVEVIKAWQQDLIWITTYHLARGQKELPLVQLFDTA